METLTITEDDAESLRRILQIFNDSRRLLIHEGSLKIDNVTLEWNDDLIRLSAKHTPPINHSPQE